MVKHLLVDGLIDIPLFSQYNIWDILGRLVDWRIFLRGAETTNQLWTDRAIIMWAADESMWDATDTGMRVADD